MEVEQIIGLAREAVFITLYLAAPLLVIGLAVGLVTGIVQAITQIHDPTISVVPRILVVFLTTVIALPWLIERMMEYSRVLFSNLGFIMGG